MKPIEQLNEEEFAGLVSRAVTSPDAPAHVIRSAVGLWATARQPTLTDLAGGLLTRVRAALSFDSWLLAPLASGMRSSTSEARHLLFSADGRDIDVRISRSAADFALTGQILGPDEAGICELRSSRIGAPDDAPRVAVLDALGEFRLDGLQRGFYTMTFRFGRQCVELPPIEIGERTG